MNIIMSDIADKSRAQVNEAIRSNVFLVNNQVIKLNEVQLIFSTLWSDISAADYSVIQKRIADFKMIKNWQPSSLHRRIIINCTFKAKILSVKP